MIQQTAAPSKVSPAGKLYAIERDGAEYSAAFYRQNGSPINFNPEWEEITRDRFYELHEQHKDYMEYSEVTRDGVLQFYELGPQLIAEHEQLEAAAAEARAVNETIDTFLADTGRI